MILFIICQSSYPCTEPLKHYSAQVSQPVSILFVIIISIFSNRFSFHSFNKHNDNSLLSHLCQLDNLTIMSLENSLHALIITDTNIRNNVATSITHIHIHDRPVIKTLHYIVNINSMEAELFAIRYGIYQATSFHGISKIVIVIDLIHSAKRIFNSLSYPFQIHTMSILCELQNFFELNQDNLIKFWKCPSQCNWSLHKEVDKETKLFNPISYYPCKSSWNFSKKKECDDLSNTWKIIFQALDLKGWHFLELHDDNNNIIEPSYVKGGSWLKFFSHSNLLCTRATRAITNHAPIGKYRLRFFPWESFNCPCGSYPIETRRHILYECERYNKYWNLRRDMVSHFILFLTFNCNAFAFTSAIM